MDWTKIKVNKALMLTLVSKMSGRVKYKLGAKAPHLGCDSAKISHLDCSGFVRYLIHRISGFVIPDGSANQLAWVAAQGFKQSTYDANGAGLCDNRLRIAFIGAYRGKVGHVWLVLNGQTIESYGGRGVGRRPWNSKTLLSKVDKVYVLTDPLI